METSIEKLDAMMGKSWMYKTTVHHFDMWRLIEQVVVISTNVKIINIPIADVPDFIEACLPSEKEREGIVTINQAMAEPKNAEFSGVQNILLDTIAKIQEDPEYIKQAKAIGATVNTMVKVANTELAYRKASHKGDI